MSLWEKKCEVNYGRKSDQRVGHVTMMWKVEMFRITVELSMRPPECIKSSNSKGEHLRIKNGVDYISTSCLSVLES